MIGLIARIGVCFKRACSPSISSAHTMNVEANVEIEFVGVVDVMLMTWVFVQFLIGIVVSPNAQRLHSAYDEFVLWCLHLKPTYVATIGVVLRMNIGCGILVSSSLILTYVLR